MKSLKLSSEQCSEIYIASGSVHPQLAQDTAKFMGLELGAIERRRFANTEQYVRFGDTVRGDHAFLIQSLAAAEGMSVNDALMELMLMVDAAKRASAEEITVVAPNMAYARQDRKARGREPISAAVVVGMLEGVGADRIVTVDLHSAQTQGTFHGPFDHLTAEPLIRSALKKRIKDDSRGRDEYVVVSPDGGGAKSAQHYAQKLGVEVVYMSKSRDRKHSSEITRPKHVDGVDGRIALITDDMIDTAGTLVSAAGALKDSGARDIIVAATHGIFSYPALERLTEAPIDEIYVTDTVPLDGAKEVLGDRLHVLPCAPLIGRALAEIATHGSVSKIFHDRNNQ